MKIIIVNSSHRPAPFSSKSDGKYCNIFMNGVKVGRAVSVVYTKKRRDVRNVFVKIYLGWDLRHSAVGTRQSTLSRYLLCSFMLQKFGENELWLGTRVISVTRFEKVNDRLVI